MSQATIERPATGTAKRAEPKVAQEPKADGVNIHTADDAAARKALSQDATWQIEALLMLLMETARQDDAGTTKLHLPMVVKALGLRLEQLNYEIMTLCSTSGENAPTADIAKIIHGG